MKKFFIMSLIIASAACQDEDGTPNILVQDDFDPSGATLLKSGMMVGVGHTVSGTVGIYESLEKKTILFDPFNSQNGPDLKVYLSKDENATEYINLGALKSIMGKQSYTIPGDPDIAEYHYVLIWCEKFTVIFGKAELM